MRARRGAARALLAVGVALVGAGGFGSAVTAGAQAGSPVVVGLTGRAASDGVGMTFGDPNAQPYPTAAGQMAHTEVALATGPTGYALASAAWPGPLVANAGSLAVLLGGPPDAAAANYGGRAEASSGGPTAAELPGMRARAEGGEAEAAAGAQQVETAPGAATGDVSTISTARLTGSQLATSSTCTATDMGFGDAVRVGSVRSEAHATSDGVAATAGGRTSVSGVSIGGLEAEVDEEGVRFVDPVTAPVGEQILSQAGMELFVGRPRSEVTGATGTHQAGPLVVVWEPPESGQTFVYSICGSDASATVRLGTPAAATGRPPAAAPTVTSPAAVPIRPAAPAPVVAGSRPAPSATPTTGLPATSPPVAAAAAPIAFVRHLGLWPYVVGALACAAGALGLRRARVEILAPRAGVTTCPLGGGTP